MNDKKLIAYINQYSEKVDVPDKWDEIVNSIVSRDSKVVYKQINKKRHIHVHGIIVAAAVVFITVYSLNFTNLFKNKEEKHYHDNTDKNEYVNNIGDTNKDDEIFVNKYQLQNGKIGGLLKECDYQTFVLSYNVENYSSTARYSLLYDKDANTVIGGRIVLDDKIVISISESNYLDDMKIDNNLKKSIIEGKEVVLCEQNSNKDNEMDYIALYKSEKYYYVFSGISVELSDFVQVIKDSISWER